VAILTKQREMMTEGRALCLKRGFVSFLLSSSAFLIPAARAETTQAQWPRVAPEPAGVEGCDRTL